MGEKSGFLFCIYFYFHVSIFFFYSHFICVVVFFFSYILHCHEGSLIQAPFVFKNKFFSSFPFTLSLCSSCSPFAQVLLLLPGAYYIIQQDSTTIFISYYLSTYTFTHAYAQISFFFSSLLCYSSYQFLFFFFVLELDCRGLCVCVCMCIFVSNTNNNFFCSSFCLPSPYSTWLKQEAHKKKCIFSSRNNVIRSEIFSLHTLQSTRDVCKNIKYIWWCWWWWRW